MLATREATVAAVTAILEDPSHAHYMSALKWASEHGYGKPKETIDVNVSKLGELSDAELETLAKRAGIA